MEKNKDRIAEIEKYGRVLKTKTHFINYLNGQKITLLQAVKCKCYDCVGFYADGAKDCKLKYCPLYPWMPYGEKEPKVKKVLTAEQKAAVVNRFKRAKFSQKAPKSQGKTEGKI
jgi:hypothetical protein